MLQEFKGVLFWLAVVLALFLYAQSGCRSRFDQFREHWQDRREHRQEERDERKEERKDRWNGFFKKFHHRKDSENVDVGSNR